jgi:hypothetical protein
MKATLTLPDGTTFEVDVPDDLGTSEEPAVWQPAMDEKYWSIFSKGDTASSVWDNDNVDAGYQEYHNIYQTKALAEKAAEATREFNKILNWVIHNDQGWEADWGNSRQKKYYVAQRDDGYVLHWISIRKPLGIVTMSEQAATRLAQLLNSGEL